MSANLSLSVQKITFTLFACFCVLFHHATAQTPQPQDSLSLPKQELRLDIFQLIVLPGIDISYERFIDEVSSWGVSGFINFDSGFDEGYRYQSFELSPYYRLYFSQGRRNNGGFFIQPFFSLVNGEFYRYHDDLPYYDTQYDQEVDFIGLAGGALIGHKWINRKKYTFEIHTGVGRYFVGKTSDSYASNTAYPRINFTIGKQF